MERLFQVILSLSVSGSLVGLLILLCRPIFGRIFSKKWTYYLWLLVIARLLVPIHADINLMAYLSGNLSAAAESWQSRVQKADVVEDVPDGTGVTEVGENAEMRHDRKDSVQGAADEIEAGADTADNKEAEMSSYHTEGMADEAVQTAMYSGIDDESAEMLRDSAEGAEAYGINGSTGIGSWAHFLWAAAVVWLCGAVFTLLRKLLIYRRFTKEICAGCAEITDQRVLNKSGEIRMRLGIGKNLPLYESGSIESPMLIGLFRPRICLPAALLTEMDGRENDVCLILHHELIHYRRRDIWYKWLFQAALCVHWFNPFVYLFSRKFNVDCELACDETVLKLLSEEGRRAYGNVLLDVAQMDWFEGTFSGKGLGTHRNVPTMTLLEEKSTLKERLRGIARYHKTGLAVGLCSAAVLVMFLAVAVVCGAADARSGSGNPFSTHNQSTFIERFVEPVWEKSLWSDMWKDFFDLDQPILVSNSGKAYRMYDDDALIAGESENDCWRAWTYVGGDGKVTAQKFAFNGSEPLWIFYANRETTLEIASAFDLYGGRFKVVWVKPDQTVQTLNENGAENTVKLTLPQGRNVIKMVGQKAKLKDLGVAYERIEKGDFDGIYNDEASEYAYLVLEGKQPFDPVKLDKLENSYPYLEGKEVSELGRKAWEEGVVLSMGGWQDLFIYSDDKLTARYLLEALRAGKVGEFDSGILVEIAPYMQAADVSACFHYLLERDAVAASDYEDIFLYSDGNQSAEYLAEALRRGKVSSFSDKTFQEICFRISTKRLTDLVTAMGKEELSFDGLEYALAFVQKQDEAVACVCHYIDLGNVLTDEQLGDVRPYIAEEDFYRIIEYNGKMK